MAVLFFVLALLSSVCCVSATEKQLNDDIREEFGRLKSEFTKLETEVKDLQNLKQKFGTVESEVKELRWLLKQQKIERSKCNCISYHDLSARLPIPVCTFTHTVEYGCGWAGIVCGRVSRYILYE